jgi:hypothetical protein
MEPLMLQNLSREISDCYNRAEECRRLADGAGTEMKAEFLDMEYRWLSLARTYELVETLSSFTATR